MSRVSAGTCKTSPQIIEKQTGEEHTLPAQRSSIIIRNTDGRISDRAFHEEILSAVDDTPLRIRSAKRVMAKGFTRAEAETLFRVKLPPDNDTK